MQASWNGVVIARSDDIVTVEGNAYFPADALVAECFRPSSHRTVCGWKGEAHYYDVVVGDLFVIQSKAGRTWFQQRVVDELDKLPRAGGRIPTLVVSSRPGPGHPTRRYVVRLLEDDVALHGERP